MKNTLGVWQFSFELRMHRFDRKGFFPHCDIYCIRLKKEPLAECYLTKEYYDGFHFYFAPLECFDMTVWYTAPVWMYLGMKEYKVYSGWPSAIITLWPINRILNMRVTIPHRLYKALWKSATY